MQSSWICTSTGTDTYPNIQEASHAWNSPCLLCTLRSAIFNGAQPLIFLAQRSHHLSIQNYPECVAVSHAYTSHRWHLNLSVTLTAMHRYNSILGLCCKISFQGSLCLCPVLNQIEREKKGKKEETNGSAWVLGKLLCFVIYILNWSLAKGRPTEVYWVGRESYCDSQFQSMNTETATQQLSVNLPEYRRDESTQVTAQFFQS